MSWIQVFSEKEGNSSKPSVVDIRTLPSAHYFNEDYELEREREREKEKDKLNNNIGKTNTNTHGQKSLVIAKPVWKTINEPWYSPKKFSLRCNSMSLVTDVLNYGVVISPAWVCVILKIPNEYGNKLVLKRCNGPSNVCIEPSFLLNNVHNKNGEQYRTVLLGSYFAERPFDVLKNGNEICIITRIASDSIFPLKVVNNGTITSQFDRESTSLGFIKSLKGRELGAGDKSVQTVNHCSFEESTINNIRRVNFDCNYSIDGCDTNVRLNPDGSKLKFSTLLPGYYDNNILCFVKKNVLRKSIILAPDPAVQVGCYRRWGYCPVTIIDIPKFSEDGVTLIDWNDKSIHVEVNNGRLDITIELRYILCFNTDVKHEPFEENNTSDIIKDEQPDSPSKCVFWCTLLFFLILTTNYLPLIPLRP